MAPLLCFEGLAKIVASTIRKLPEDKESRFHMLKALLSHADSLLAEKDKEKEKNKETTQVVPEKDVEDKAEVPVEEIQFEVGMVVILNVQKSKEKYNGREAKILRVLSKKLRVEMITGPCRGEEKVVEKEKVTLAKAPTDLSKPVVVESTKSGGPDSENDKNSKLADSLFGGEED